MTKRALLFDIGNTRLKWGVLDAGQIKRTGMLAHDKLAERGFGALTSKLPTNVDAVLASNVAGAAFGARLSSVIGLHCGADVRFARSTRAACGVVSAYKHPRQLGVDRWAAMIGARAEFRSSLCIVDAGSAITIDALDGDGNHLGGQIIPGLRMMADSLKMNTSGMSELRVRTADPGTGMALFAKETSHGVQAGALNAVCGAVERAVRILRAERLRPKIILTGGGATPILNELQGSVMHRPHLVLEGLAAMTKCTKARREGTSRGRG
jgi:type III pantothenate kinase